MTIPDPKLEQFRQQIDAIDDQLIALLKQRIAIVEQVGKHKHGIGQKGLFIRPGREGQMHRRIAEAFADSAMPAEAALAMWRLLIGASTHRESALRIGALADTGCGQMAREYFGTFLNCRDYATTEALTEALASDDINLAVLPYPRTDKKHWQYLVENKPEGVHIFAHLPVLCAPDTSSALAFGAVTPEPSGKDESLWAVFDPQSIPAPANPISQSGGWHLLRFDGFFDATSELPEQLNALSSRPAVFLGAYPL